MTRLPILTCCLLLNGSLAAQTQPLEQQPVPAQQAAGGSQKLYRDQGAKDSSSEWWQLTARMTDRDGRPWTLEWSLYLQQPGPRSVGNRQPTDGMSLAHAAITTPDGIYHQQRITRRDDPGTDPSALSGRANHDDPKQGWEWVSQGETLLPARLSFSVGERDVNLLLEAADRSGGQPLVRVRGFVDRGASKTYLRGQGRLDREWHAPVPAGEPALADLPVTRKISSPPE